MCGSTGQVREMRHKYIVLIEKGTLGGKTGTTRKQNAVRAGNGLRLTTIWPGQEQEQVSCMAKTTHRQSEELYANAKNAECR